MDSTRSPRRAIRATSGLAPAEVNASLTAVLDRFHVLYSFEGHTLLLPVGISFYTFQTLSYTIDVYRGDREPEAYFAPASIGGRAFGPRHDYIWFTAPSAAPARGCGQ